MTNDNGVYDTDYVLVRPVQRTRRRCLFRTSTTVTSTITIGGSALELVRDVNVTLDITHSVRRRPRCLSDCAQWDSSRIVHRMLEKQSRGLYINDAGRRSTFIHHFRHSPVYRDVSSGRIAGRARRDRSAGTWTLEITDDLGATDTGTLNSWSLQLGVTREFQNTTSLPIPNAADHHLTDHRERHHGLHSGYRRPAQYFAFCNSRP
jgi:hypothetical protein